MHRGSRRGFRGGPRGGHFGGHRPPPPPRFFRRGLYRRRGCLGCLLPVIVIALGLVAATVFLL